MRAVLVSPIRMVNQPRQRPFGRHGPKQGLADEVLGDPGSHRLSDNFSREHILAPCQI